MKSWECLYFHCEKKLFLSAYVDDYKMAGKKENLGPMWDTLRSHGLELEPAVSLKSKCLPRMCTAGSCTRHGSRLCQARDDDSFVT